METRHASESVRQGRQANRSATRRGRADQGAIDRIVARVSSEVGEERYERYFQRQARLSLNDGCLDVTVPTGFVADFLDRRFGDTLRRALEDEGQELCFRIDGGAFDPTDQTASDPTPAQVRKRPRRRKTTRREHALEDLVVGDANELAYSAALRLTEPDCPRAMSPLFVHAHCGLGKTHLLQGIARRFKEVNPEARVCSTTGESFTNDYVAAVKENTLLQFRRRYRHVDLLCVDDVHFVANKRGTQSELLHTFNAIDLEGARIVIASDTHPRAIGRLSEALVSRFMAGMVVQLASPGRNLCIRLVRHLAERRGLKMDDVAIGALVDEAGRRRRPGEHGVSVRELEGVLTQVDAASRLLPGATAGRVGMAVVRQALDMTRSRSGGAGGSRPTRPLRVQTISEVVCETLEVDLSELLGRGRHRRVVLARSLTAALARMLTTYSFPEIARAMARPNHSTIVTACRRVEEQVSAGLQVNVGSSLDGLTMQECLDRLAELIRDRRE